MQCSHRRVVVFYLCAHRNNIQSLTKKPRKAGKRSQANNWHKLNVPCLWLVRKLCLMNFIYLFRGCHKYFNWTVSRLCLRLYLHFPILPMAPCVRMYVCYQTNCYTSRWTVFTKCKIHFALRDEKLQHGMYVIRRYCVCKVVPNMD